MQKWIQDLLSWQNILGSRQIVADIKEKISLLGYIISGLQ